MLPYGFQDTLVLPRPKYTFFAVFNINPFARVGNFFEGYRSGKILAALKGIDHPQSSFEVEALRSYNKVRLVKKRYDLKPFTVKFHDDATGFVLGLWKSYRQFHTHAGDVRSNEEFGQKSISTAQADQAAEVRANPNRIPSLGLKLRPVRNFFRDLTLYDLGTAPNSINVYHFVNPMIVDMNHSENDYSDRTGQLEVTFTMQAEGYWEEVAEHIEEHLGVFGQLGNEYARSFGFFEDAFPGGYGRSDERSGQWRDTDRDFLYGQTDNYALGGFSPLSIVSRIARNTINYLPDTLFRTLSSGKFSADRFKDTLINRGLAGTPLQTIRQYQRQIKLAGKSANKTDRYTFIARSIFNRIGRTGGIGYGRTGVGTRPYYYANDAYQSSSLATANFYGASRTIPVGAAASPRYGTRSGVYGYGLGDVPLSTVSRDYNVDAYANSRGMAGADRRDVLVMMSRDIQNGEDMERYRYNLSGQSDAS
jgi:hypothetical protein